LLLQPGMQNGIGRPLHGLGAYLPTRRMEQSQEFGGASPYIFVRTPCWFAFRLPGSAGLRNGLVGAGFIFGPGGNACRFG
jgi:hypothetical protein